MTPLGHAEAHERLADLALEPGALDRLGSPATDPLAAHVATCGACESEVRAWRQTHAGLRAALGSGAERLELRDLATDDPVGVPPGLRAAVLGAVRDRPASDRRPAVPLPASGDPRPVAPRSPRRLGGPGRLLPLVAVLAVVVGGAGLLVDQARRLDRAQQETAGLEALAATVDRVLSDPGHRVASLRGADGTASGTVSWSTQDIVVLTMALAPPAPDRIYRCWIERDGVRSPVGQMWFSGGTAYWDGSLDEWATTSFGAGGTFGISLEPIAGSEDNPPVLVADLGS